MENQFKEFEQSVKEILLLEPTGQLFIYSGRINWNQISDNIKYAALATLTEYQMRVIYFNTTINKITVDQYNAPILTLIKAICANDEEINKSIENYYHYNLASGISISLENYKVKEWQSVLIIREKFNQHKYNYTFKNSTLKRTN